MRWPTPKPTLLEGDMAAKHTYVSADDEIYFFFEYTSGGGYQHSDGNDLVSNLQKDVVRFGDKSNIMRYKAQAIQHCRDLIVKGFKNDIISETCVVPVPPSIVPGEEGHDDRMLQVARGVFAKIDASSTGGPRDLIRQRRSIRKSKASTGDRVSVEELMEVYSIDEKLIEPRPHRIAIIDDVLTVGRHWYAVKERIVEAFPAAEIFGIFVSRAVSPTPSAFDVFDAFKGNDS
ncbi:MAG: hypothetical protein AAFX81_01780 [Pseudomonadota bacterium]